VRKCEGLPLKSRDGVPSAEKFWNRNPISRKISGTKFAALEKSGVLLETFLWAKLSSKIGCNRIRTKWANKRGQAHHSKFPFLTKKWAPQVAFSQIEGESVGRRKKSVFRDQRSPPASGNWIWSPHLGHRRWIHFG
jgi:hypothetical protein